MSIPGLIITAFIMIFLKKKPIKNGCSYIIEIGGNWGGLELGCVAIIGEYTKISPTYYEHIRRHEFGHSIQQLMFGPFMLFVVTIPSAIRYWYRILTPGPHPDYDDAIFEYTASKWGYKWINWIENTNLEYKYQRVKK